MKESGRSRCNLKIKLSDVAALENDARIREDTTIDVVYADKILDHW